MNILMVIERFYPLIGGAETQCFNLSKYFSIKGNHVSIVTKRWNNSSAAKEQFPEGFIVNRIGFIAKNRLSDYLSGVLLVRWMIANRNVYDLVFVNGGLANIFGSTAIIVSKLLGIKVVVKVETPGELYFSGSKALSPVRFVHPLIKFRLSLIKRADYFVSQTLETTRQITDFGIDSNIIFSAPNTVDTGLFTSISKDQKIQLRKKLALPLSETIILFVGRLVKRKGLLVLIKSWKNIIAKRKDVKLVLIGSGIHQSDSVENEIKIDVESDTSQSIHLAGEKNREEVLEYLHASDVFVYPSIHPEGTALSILEAMSVGLPVVASDIGGLSDVIVNEQNGILVDPGNVSELTFAINKTIINLPKLDSMVKEARKSILEKYSVEAVGQKYIDFFKAVISS